ncbi:sigma-70 family RNA polymerase sigma factor [Sporolactobacillus inulinus]|uniref:sigma-70 family RNA polymerase sigma factor n=1 Tax=Sporolactobacillus inulinus TaxID=2078 RepID=UPI0021CC797C|nr:sigma-70 family RNA polymerase sigma factor [Sporolactobacillus inulinus]
MEKENYYFYNTVSYYERVKGYLNLPTQFISNVEKVKDQYFGKLQLEIEKFIYECWWRIKDDKLYCYGDGIFDFYADYIIKPGHRLKIEFKSDDTININLIGIDERYAKEQTRYLDIGKLAEESNSVNKSIFTIMCEVLATYPSGMHWTTLYDKVNELRMTTQNTVTNLLSKNPCFENLQDKKGYWRLNVSKLSRYYINEENKEVVQTTDLSYKPESNVQRKIINKRDYSDRENRSYYKDPHPIDQEYELPPLKDSFRNWAKKQPSIRYNKLVNQAQNQSQLIEIVTKAYSKLLCKFASSRETYSLEYMDLVQEGFLGLYKAIKKYNGKNSFAHYARTWINQRLGRYKIDKSNLIRIPVHMVEEINKLNKFIDEYLINENKFPNKNEVSEAEINTNAYDYISLYTIDYVSFEQYWGYLAGESNLTYTNPWYAGELISSNLYRTYYLSKGKKYKEEIEDLLKIEEQNSEILWTEMSVDTEINEKVLRHILYEFLNKLTEKEKKVLEFRFGLLDNKERTLEEVGEILGVTRERIRQIEKKALNKLRNLKKIKRTQSLYYLIFNFKGR